jgi:hypothetical protein
MNIGWYWQGRRGVRPGLMRNHTERGSALRHTHLAHLIPSRLALLLLAVAPLGQRLAAVALVALEAACGAGQGGGGWGGKWQQCKLWGSRSNGPSDSGRRHSQRTQRLEAGALVAESLLLAID